MSGTPSFRGQRALILHRRGETTERLARQLALLGLSVEVRWQPLADVAGLDVVLVDADEGWTGLLPWQGAEDKPVPLVALLASEAPGRIAWALDQGADALLPKPVTPSSVYPALVIAARRHDEACARAEMLNTCGNVFGSVLWCSQPSSGCRRRAAGPRTMPIGTCGARRCGNG